MSNCILSPFHRQPPALGRPDVSDSAEWSVLDIKAPICELGNKKGGSVAGMDNGGSVGRSGGYLRDLNWQSNADGHDREGKALISASALTLSDSFRTKSHCKFCYLSPNITLCQNKLLKESCVGRSMV